MSILPSETLPLAPYDEWAMELALEQARKAQAAGEVPVGAVLVRAHPQASQAPKVPEVVACGHNQPISNHDPTAHAEISAIRAACRRLGTHDLSGAVLYSSCECCPMCYSAAYWARISRVFYAAAWADYADLFDDATLDLDIRKPNPERALNPRQLLRDEALAVWAEFRLLPDGARY